MKCKCVGGRNVSVKNLSLGKRNFLLGPVLANIFVGFYEQQLPIDKDKSFVVYHRFVDDTFSLNINREAADDLLGKLNNLHPALQITCEHEKNSKLPFLDAFVHKEHQQTDELCSVLPCTENRRSPASTLGGTHLAGNNTRST